MMRLVTKAVLCFALLIFSACFAVADSRWRCPGSNEVAVTPTGPGATTSTDVTQCGVVDVENGWSRGWQNSGPTQQTLTTSFRLGLARNVDIKWAFDALQLHPGVSSGEGDNWLSARYRFHAQGKSTPALAVMYTAKIATASSALGFGTGFNDHNLALLASKDFGHLHVDSNLLYNWFGRKDGWDENVAAAMAGSVALNRRWAVSAETVGATRLNATTPESVSVSFGLTYTVSPRTVVYGGYGFGVSGPTTSHLLIGMAYSIGDLYKTVFHARPQTTLAQD